MAEDCCGMQLIDGNGIFNVKGLENFTRTTKFSDSALSYAVVAIIGPQSSGKSTLMNHLFYTKFVEMDAYEGRNQTTKGIWIAKCNGIQPFTIAMDVEGTDSMERGEDDTTFEKQSTLFALATADVILINIWCHEIGREQASSRPLLKTVFQAMMRLFGARKVTLLFVIRDKTKTPFEILERLLKENAEKLWAAVAKPEAHRNAPLSEFFDVEVVALPSYEEREDQFKEEIAHLRQRFVNSISPGRLAGNRHEVEPASVFSIRTKEIWKTIKDDKHLDLPALKVMIAAVKCEEIANEKLGSFTCNKDWLALEKYVKAGPVSGFGNKLSSILQKYLSQYDKETNLFEESVRNAKRQQLKSRALDVAYPAYATMLEHLSYKTLESFKISLAKALNKGKGFAASVHACEQSGILDFEKKCEDATVRQPNDWDASEVQEKLRSDIRTHVSAVHNASLSEMVAKYEKQICDGLTGDLQSIFMDDKRDTWESIRHHLECRIQVAVSEFSSTAVDSFELDQSIIHTKVQNLRDHAQNVVTRKAKEEAGSVLSRMKYRFVWVFNHDNHSKARVWKRGENIESIKKNALIESLKILSTMAAMRLDTEPDNIENLLFSSLIDGSTPEALALKKWEMVSPETMLLSPEHCQLVWQNFLTQIEYTVSQAKSAQKAQEENIKAQRNMRWIAGTVGSVVGLGVGGGAMAKGVDPYTAFTAGKSAAVATIGLINGTAGTDNEVDDVSED